ncbi:MAG: hypothetical protein QGF59_05235 [Pirellulaceae bacterium]|jgi:hypothetical protein|nr:hypothetical protein [Pirellulaceae bacterium]
MHPVALAAIRRDDANPTNANTAVFSVDFSEDVANVTAADFTLALAGVTANATVTVGNAGDADASTYTVTVDTIAGDGTLGLDIAGGNDIIDLVSNAASTTPTTDEVYTLNVPIIDLDADNSSGAFASDFQTTFNIGGGAVSVVDTDGTLTDNTANLVSVGCCIRRTGRDEPEGHRDHP